MKYLAHIRRNATGEVRTWDDDTCLNEITDSTEFFWSDGNFGCDCNRELVFAWAAGAEEGIDDVVCGSDRFAVNLENVGTGEIFYREFD